MWQFWVLIGILFVFINLVSLFAERGASRNQNRVLIKLRDLTTWIHESFVSILVTFIAVAFIGGLLDSLRTDMNSFSQLLSLGIIIFCLIVIWYMWRED